jgi:hypothetical protein
MATAAPTRHIIAVPAFYPIVLNTPSHADKDTGKKTRERRVFSSFSEAAKVGIETRCGARNGH